MIKQTRHHVLIPELLVSKLCYFHTRRQFPTVSILYVQLDKQTCVMYVSAKDLLINATPESK